MTVTPTPSQNRTGAVPIPIDTRFLSVHPRTALWWEQRKTCAECAHCTIAPISNYRRSDGGNNSSGGQWLCSQTRISYGQASPCIYARDEGSPCGPDAKLFKAKEEQPV